MISIDYWVQSELVEDPARKVGSNGQKEKEREDIVINWGNRVFSIRYRACREPTRVVEEEYLRCLQPVGC